MPLLKHDVRLTDWFILDSKDGGFFFLVFIVKSDKIYKSRWWGNLEGRIFFFWRFPVPGPHGVQVKGLGSGSRVHAGRCWKARAVLGRVPRQTLLVPSPHHPSGQDLKTSVVLRPGRPFEPRLPTMGCTCPWGPRVRMLWQGPNTILTPPPPPPPVFFLPQLQLKDKDTYIPLLSTQLASFQDTHMFHFEQAHLLYIFKSCYIIAFESAYYETLALKCFWKASCLKSVSAGSYKASPNT